MANEHASIEIKGVSKHFVERKAKREITVFEDFDLEIRGNELLVILGPSGCGKTTLLKMMAGLVAPDRGEIAVMGEPMQPYNPFAVTIFQEYSLFPWRTALGNVELPLETKTWGRKIDKKLRQEKALQALTEVGLEDRLHSYPKELSVGMQQRVALARSVVVEPKILLMDEPFGSLDAGTRAEMQRMLVGLWNKRNLVVFVTHDIEEALILAERVVVLSERPARILDQFTIDVAHPRNSDFLLQESTKKWRNRILETLYTQLPVALQKNEIQPREHR